MKDVEGKGWIIKESTDDDGAGMMNLVDLSSTSPPSHPRRGQQQYPQRLHHHQLQCRYEDPHRSRDKDKITVKTPPRASGM